MFQARLPIDHVMALVNAIRNDEATISSTLISVGMISGELGTFMLENNFLASEFSSYEVPSTLDGLFEMVESLSNQAQDDAQLNPIWIPVIIKVIELILARLG